MTKRTTLSAFLAAALTYGPGGTGAAADVAAAPTHDTAPIDVLEIVGTERTELARANRVEPTGVARGVDLAPSRVLAATSIAQLAAPIPGAIYAAPDVISDDIIGGYAIRLHTVNGTALPGDVFLLAAHGVNDRKVFVFDDTPYTTTSDRAHADTIAANINAHHVATTITGSDVPLLDLTTSGGGGPSGGVAYTIAYLDVISNGGFTGDLRVAGTGRVWPGGRYNPVDGIEQKVAAAYVADVGVMFSAGMPTTLSEAHDLPVRIERASLTNIDTARASLSERVEMYTELGVTRPTDGLDVVGISHVIDIAAYLCGSGSDYACEIVDLIDDSMVQQLQTLPASQRSVEEALAAASAPVALRSTALAAAQG
jgi:hypothetical protein